MQTPPETTPQRRRDAFGMLFPQPTGANGYEELVLAVDLLQNSPEFSLFDSTEAPHSLATIRKLLIVPDVNRALELIHIGLAKPVVSPYGLIDSDTIFPEMSGFRAIARLLPNLIIHGLAFGNSTAALDWLELGIRFAHSIQQKLRIAGLVGMSCDAILLARCSERIELLSERDCLRFQQILTARIDQPQTYPDILRGDLEYSRRTLLKARDDDKLRLEALNETQSDVPSEQIVAEQLRNDPDSAKRSMIEAINQLDLIYEQAIRVAMMPPWKRPAPKALPELSPEAQYWLAIRVPFVGRTQSRCDQIEVQYRLLATRVLLRRYRWEHDAHPENLLVFEEKRLVEDPFSGKPLSYARRGNGYELYSIGDFSFDANDIQSKERTPIYLPRRN